MGIFSPHDPDDQHDESDDDEADAACVHQEHDRLLLCYPRGHVFTEDLNEALRRWEDLHPGAGPPPLADIIDRLTAISAARYDERLRTTPCFGAGRMSDVGRPPSNAPP